jgi:hypothetical protein
MIFQVARVPRLRQLGIKRNGWWAGACGQGCGVDVAHGAWIQSRASSDLRSGKVRVFSTPFSPLCVEKNRFVGSVVPVAGMRCLPALPITAPQV